MGNPNTPLAINQGHTDTQISRCRSDTKKGVAVAAEGRPSEGLGENIRSIVMGRNAANSNNAVSHVLPHFEITTGKMWRERLVTLRSLASISAPVLST